MHMDGVRWQSVTTGRSNSNRRGMKRSPEPTLFLEGVLYGVLQHRLEPVKSIISKRGHVVNRFILLSNAETHCLTSRYVSPNVLLRGVEVCAMPSPIVYLSHQETRVKVLILASFRSDALCEDSVFPESIVELDEFKILDFVRFVFSSRGCEFRLREIFNFYVSNMDVFLVAISYYSQGHSWAHTTRKVSAASD